MHYKDFDLSYLGTKSCFSFKFISLEKKLVNKGFLLNCWPYSVNIKQKKRILDATLGLLLGVFVIICQMDGCMEILCFHNFTQDL